MLDFDGLLEKIGPFGRYQIFFYVIIGITSAPAGMQVLLSVYLFATPRHWCHVTELANLSVAEQRLLTVPPGELSGNPTDDSCYIYDVNYTEVLNNYVNNYTKIISNHSAITECTQWSYDLDLYGPTAVSSWNLICAQSYKRSLASSSIMLGFMIGVALFGYISDRIGRKLAWLTGLVAGVIFSTIASFMPEYWSFIILRMFAGVALSGCYTVGFVLVMEMIGKKKRVIPGVAYHMWFTLGYVSSSAFAFLIKNYVWLNFTVSVIPALFILFYWIMPESARWLLSTGRTSLAKCEIHRMGRINRIPTTDTLLAFEAFLMEEAKKDTSPERKYNMIDLLRTPNMRRRSFIVLFTWFVISMVFYGISLGIADLAGDPYINMVISGVSECIGIGVAVFALNRLGRPWPLCVMMVFGGINCLAVNLLPSGWKVFGTVLAMLGKFGVAGSFSIIYIFTAELFPTVVRTIAVGSGSMGARFGALIAPFITDLGTQLWPPLPMVIFGIMALLSGVLSLLLPETFNRKLPETLEEGEEFGTNNEVRLLNVSKKSKIALLQKRT